MSVKYFLAMVCLAVFTAGPLWADDTVFARQGELVLTNDEIDAAFAQIPELYRGSFIRDGKRVDQLIQNLFRNKLVAADAAKNGYDKDPIAISRVKIAGEKEMALAWMEQVLANAPQPDYEALAYERYLANPEEYQTEEMVDVSHILVQSGTRNEDEAREMAEELRAKLMENPELFDEYVMEFSEDPAKSSNKGRYPRSKRGEMVKPFEDMAFSLREPGEISELVETSYGFHILRLNAKIPPQTLPFDSVKQQIISADKKEFLEDYQTRYIFTLVPEPVQIDEGAVEAMVKRHFGENLEKLPDYLK
ncbi:MAG: peptidylprolyl isomerase [Xanthomonadales bacterium]|jgi:peptidyl-prolyl cis-trans isomerase C|nr:peptidylprolyl isomerase [Xanthomonadales bacterium]